MLIDIYIRVIQPYLWAENECGINTRTILFGFFFFLVSMNQEQTMGSEQEQNKQATREMRLKSLSLASRLLIGKRLFDANNRRDVEKCSKSKGEYNKWQYK